MSPWTIYSISLSNRTLPACFFFSHFTYPSEAFSFPHLTLTHAFFHSCLAGNDSILSHSSLSLSLMLLSITRNSSQQTFVEHLRRARHCARRWRQIQRWKVIGPLPPQEAQSLGWIKKHCFYYIIFHEIPSPCEASLGISWNKVHSWRVYHRGPLSHILNLEFLSLWSKASEAQAYGLSSKLWAGGNCMLGSRGLAAPVCFGGG